MQGDRGIAADIDFPDGSVYLHAGRVPLHTDDTDKLERGSDTSVLHMDDIYGFGHCDQGGDAPCP